MKKILAIVLALSLVLALCAACGSESAANQPSSSGADSDKQVIKAAVTVSDIADKVPSYVAAGVQYWADQLYPGEFEFTVLNGNMDVDTQTQLVNDSVTAGIDVLFIHPTHDTAMVSVAQSVKDQGIPVININKELKDGYNEYIGNDEYNFSKVAADATAEMLNGEGKVVVIAGQIGADNATARTQAVKDMIDANPGMELVGEEWTDWARASSMAIVENLITSGLEFDTVIANCDELAIGAALAIEGSGLNLDDYFIVGLDTTPDGITFMEDGYLDLTVYSSTSSMCKTAVEDAYAMIKGEKEAPDGEQKLVDLTVVTPDNMNVVLEDSESLANWIEENMK